MNCSTYELNEILAVVLPERIDSNNASIIEEEIFKIKQGTTKHLIFDAKKLEYISSAGLRVVLKFKKLDEKLEIINVNTEVYDIFDMTGFSEMIPITKAYKQMNVDGCKVIGKGAKGTVYRFNDDTVVKVYNDLNSLEGIKNERELAKNAFVLGIPTAISFDIVKVGDKFGTVYELLDAKSLSELISEDPDNLEKYVKTFADMLKLVHSTTSNSPIIKSIKEKIEPMWLKYLLPYFNDEEMAKIRKLINDLPDSKTLLHCDYHPNNVMMQNGEALLIDMDTMCYGYPIFDLTNVYYSFVSQMETEKEKGLKFLNINEKCADLFWPLFAKHYFNKYSEDEINEITKKIRFMSFIRAIRHTSKRLENDLDKEHLKYDIDEMRKLLKVIDCISWEQK